MTRLVHITPAGTSSQVQLASAQTDELLDAYSSWLFFERHFLLIGCFGVQNALCLMNTVRTDNAGAAFHFLASTDLPDYSKPSGRAALVLATAGVDVGKLRLGAQ